MVAVSIVPRRLELYNGKAYSVRDYEQSRILQSLRKVLRRCKLLEEFKLTCYEWHLDQVCRNLEVVKATLRSLSLCDAAGFPKNMFHTVWAPLTLEATCSSFVELRELELGIDKRHCAVSPSMMLPCDLLLIWRIGLCVT